ncbi:MAG TPA: hypothetical protein VNT01_04005 [Symbiobacteriaceae bacterium]|nr:hypothetical protein [Symbiobacteriaceae bacterium]
MYRNAAHHELQSYLKQAVEVLSEQRVALGAGCSVTSVQHWLRRDDVHPQAQTIKEVLPRLRGWEAWVHGYLAGLVEIRRLEGDGIACWENRVTELQDRLEQASQTHSLQQIALACEVPEQRVLLWRLGYFIDKHLDDIIRSLAHLRHIEEWPCEPAAEPERERVGTA